MNCFNNSLPIRYIYTNRQMKMISWHATQFLKNSLFYYSLKNEYRNVNYHDREI